MTYQPMLDDYFYQTIDNAIRRTIQEEPDLDNIDDVMDVAKAKLPWGFAAYYGHENVEVGMRLRMPVLTGQRAEWVPKNVHIDPARIHHALDNGDPLYLLMYEDGESVPGQVIETWDPETDRWETFIVDAHNKGEEYTITRQSDGQKVNRLPTADEVVAYRTEVIGPEFMINFKEAITGTREAGTWGRFGEGWLGQVEIFPGTRAAGMLVIAAVVIVIVIILAKVVVPVMVAGSAVKAAGRP